MKTSTAPSTLNPDHWKIEPWPESGGRSVDSEAIRHPPMAPGLSTLRGFLTCGLTPWVKCHSGTRHFNKYEAFCLVAVRAAVESLVKKMKLLTSSPKVLKMPGPGPQAALNLKSERRPECSARSSGKFQRAEFLSIS